MEPEQPTFDPPNQNGIKPDGTVEWDPASINAAFGSGTYERITTDTQAFTREQQGRRTIAVTHTQQLNACGVPAKQRLDTLGMLVPAHKPLVLQSGVLAKNSRL